MLAVCLAIAQGATLPEKKSSAVVDPLEEAAEVEVTAGGERLKRSGDLLGYIGTKIGNKISSIASASAGLSSASSQPKPEYGPPVSVTQKTVDRWEDSNRTDLKEMFQPLNPCISELCFVTYTPEQGK